MKVKIQKIFFLENILCNCTYTVNRLSDIVMLRSSDWQIGLQIFQTKHCPTRLFTDLFFSSGVVRLRLYWIYYICIDKKSNGNPVGAIRSMVFDSFPASCVPSAVTWKYHLLLGKLPSFKYLTCRWCSGRCPCWFSPVTGGAATRPCCGCPSVWPTPSPPSSSSSPACLTGRQALTAG